MFLRDTQQKQVLNWCRGNIAHLLEIFIKTSDLSVRLDTQLSAFGNIISSLTSLSRIFYYIRHTVMCLCMLQSRVKSVLPIGIGANASWHWRQFDRNRKYTEFFLFYIPTKQANYLLSISEQYGFSSTFIRMEIEQSESVLHMKKLWKWKWIRFVRMFVSGFPFSWSYYNSTKQHFIDFSIERSDNNPCKNQLNLDIIVN